MCQFEVLAFTFTSSVCPNTVAVSESFNTHSLIKASYILEINVKFMFIVFTLYVLFLLF